MIHQGIHNLPPTEKQEKYNTSSMNSSPNQSTSAEQSLKELEQKVAALEKQLRWEQLRSEALNTMIDIAEKDLNVSIRKKPGAQSSKKTKSTTQLHQLAGVVQTVGLFISGIPQA